MIGLSGSAIAAALLASVALWLPTPVAARLGSAENASQASEGPAAPSASEPTAALTGLMGNVTSFYGTLGAHNGYHYKATTTRYGDASASACGGMSTSSLIAGTSYYNVASAQAMQGGSCCWCGRSGSGNGHHTGTAPMGCFQCAKGRFVHERPHYGLAALGTGTSALGSGAGASASASGLRASASASGAGSSAPALGAGASALASATAASAGRGGDLTAAFASDEIHVVVGDLCPHTGNEVWCPEKPGHQNWQGMKNHLDFSHPPHGIDNNYFVFTPVECSHELKARMARASRCGR